ncbi:MAG TPA: lysophospholipid acyltransferase family protein [Pyrinomonadaceae bacterium]
METGISNSPDDADGTDRAPGSSLSAKVDRAYAFADLSRYSFKDRLLIRVADLAFFSIISLIGSTVRYEIEGWENFEATTRDGNNPIYSFWHNTIFLSIYFWQRRRIVVMTSQSFDGEYIARFVQRFGNGAARGSSTRGATGAMVEMVRLMRAGNPAAFTIDGPKGPRYVAKMGSVLLAKKTGCPILPFTITPAKFWEIKKSWDLTQVPRPFTRARVFIAPPIHVPADADEALLSAKRDELQEALDSVVKQGELWRAAVSQS